MIAFIDTMKHRFGVEGICRTLTATDGISQRAPVVVVDDHNHWSGYRPDLIDNLS